MFCFYEKDEKLSKLLGFNSKKKPIYKTAFKHKSFCEKQNNERLEFLGDSILNIIVSEHVFLKHKNKEEGFLSKKRSLIVARKHLNMVGKKIINEKHILSNLKKTPDSVFGNTLEAIIGAIYIDKGIQKTRCFVKKNIINSSFIKENTTTDYKTQLQINTQKQNKKIKYRVIKKEGPDHRKEFTVAVFVDKKNIAIGKSSSIKDAEQKAAEKALKIVF